MNIHLDRITIEYLLRNYETISKIDSMSSINCERCRGRNSVIVQNIILIGTYPYFIVGQSPYGVIMGDRRSPQVSCYICQTQDPCISLNDFRSEKFYGYLASMDIIYE